VGRLCSPDPTGSSETHDVQRSNGEMPVDVNLHLQRKMMSEGQVVGAKVTQVETVGTA